MTGEIALTSLLALASLFHVAACGEPASATSAAAEPTPAAEPPAPIAGRIADLPIDGELARRLAELADRIDRDPRAFAALLRADGLTLEGYVERLYVIALDARLAAIYSDSRRPPDIASQSHVLGDEDE